MTPSEINKPLHLLYIGGAVVVDKIIFPAGGMETDATISDETDRNVETDESHLS